MGDGHTGNFKKEFRLYVSLAMLWNSLILCGLGYVLLYETPLNGIPILFIMMSALIVASLISATWLTKKLTRPTEYLANAILHISPNQHLVAAPNTDELTFGKELIQTLTRQIYDFASSSSQIPAPAVTTSSAMDQDLIDAVPVVLIGVDAEGKITFANKPAREMLGTTELIGIPLAERTDMKFAHQSLSEWLDETRDKSVSATNIWQKVDVGDKYNDKRSYYDIAANFRQHHSSGTETLLAFFEHGNAYNAEEDALSLVAVAVHEIRTPITILRGYIEALEEELEGKMDIQLAGYIARMSSSAESLSIFVSNILAVTRADQNKLILNLKEENWEQVLFRIVDTMKERAKVNGKKIELTVAPNLPAVAIDKISINEVITNLVDNALKYSTDKSNTIWVDSVLNEDGWILTTVRDEGVGIPESVVPNLFAKFSRNHRNRNQISGTGLGLFLSKAIISAHKGNIWVKSKEDQGTTIGFTVMPFDQLAEHEKKDDNGITRTSHGWIKNHSMQRR